MRIQFYIIVFLVTIGCTKETSGILDIREFSSNGYLNRTAKGKLMVRETKDSIIYLYTSDTLDYDYTFTKIKNRDNRLIAYGTELLYVGTKMFQIGKKEIIVDRFEYDDPTMSDEEERIFYAHDYGVISIQKEARAHTTLFLKGQQVANDLVIELENDTSGFYRAPPPPRNM